MNHLPYEEWLLSDEPLSPEQQMRLEEHLSSCEACQQLADAWQSLANVLRVIPEVAPTPGFAQRWQARQLQRRTAQHRHITWIVLLLCISGSFATLLGLALPQVGGLSTPIKMISTLLHSTSLLLGSFQDIQAVLGAIFTHVPLGIPVLLWMIVSMSVAVWSVIWFAFIWRLPKFKRSQNEVFN
ncbi:MAG: zf-HC2 domain-containing protein [Anaerolineaceae bacterium]|nr:zf-HC2 domain-containing protein [Anaerolineaceae bacterium]